MEQTVGKLWDDDKAHRDLPRAIDSETKPVRTVDVARRPREAAGGQAEPLAVNEGEPVLADCRWVWVGGGNPAARAAVGSCHFRKLIDVPADKRIKSAQLIIDADNTAVPFVNGTRVDDSGLANWQAVSDIDITAQVRPGANLIAVEVVNGSTEPNPAGLIGKVVVAFADGGAMTAKIDETWKAAATAPANWTVAGFDDTAWAAAVPFADYGQGPWGDISARALTRSPIAKADPFEGTFVVPAGIDLKKVRAVLVLDDVKPEAAARITINGAYAGGVIEKPLQLDVTRLVRPGENALGIEPFAPSTARVVFYEK